MKDFTIITDKSLAIQIYEIDLLHSELELTTNETFTKHCSSKLSKAKGAELKRFITDLIYDLAQEAATLKKDIARIKNMIEELKRWN